MRTTTTTFIAKATLVTAALACASPAPAQQATVPQGFADLALPSSDVTPHTEYVKAIARAAYIWGWPMLNMLNRRERITQAPEPGLMGGILPVAPRGRLAMLNDYIVPVSEGTSS